MARRRVIWIRRPRRRSGCRRWWSVVRCVLQNGHPFSQCSVAQHRPDRRPRTIRRRRFQLRWRVCADRAVGLEFRTGNSHKRRVGAISDRDTISQFAQIMKRRRIGVADAYHNSPSPDLRRIVPLVTVAKPRGRRLLDTPGRRAYRERDSGALRFYGGHRLLYGTEPGRRGPRINVGPSRLIDLPQACGLLPS